MENKKDIGNAFREKLDQLDQTPPDRVWEAIYADLQPKKKRRAAWIWFPAALALIGLAVFSGYHYFISKEKTGDVITNVPIETKAIHETKVGQQENNADAVKTVSSGNNAREKFYGNRKATGLIQDKKISITKDKQLRPKRKIGKNAQKPVDWAARKWTHYKKLKAERQKRAYKKLFSDKLTSASSGDLPQNGVATGTIAKTFDPTAGLGKELFFSTETDSAQVALTDSIPKKKKTNEDDGKELESDTKKTAFLVGAFYGPTYYSSPGGHSIMQEARGYSGKGEIGSAYGAFLRFKIGEKMTLGFGVGKTTYKLTTSITERNANNSFFYFQQIGISGNDDPADINAYFENDAKVRVQHKIEYLEVPIFASYNLYEKAIGIDATAGMSIYKLSGNTLSASSATQPSRNIGKLNTLLETTASFNGGVQFYYNLGSKWRIEVTPTLRYYLKPTENSTSFKPYSVTVQAGMSYKL